MHETVVGRSRACLGAVGLAAALAWGGVGLAADAESDGQTVSDIPEDKRAQVTRVTSVPVIDGVFDDPMWVGVPETTGFIQHRPNEGDEPSFQTSFRVAHDDANLYVAIILEDPEPDLIVDRIHRRDQDSNTDWAAVYIDGYLDRRTARFFAVNAGGVQQDGTVVNDGNIDTAWDAVWGSAVQITSEGWQVELRIPLNALRFNQDGGPWGFQILRYINRFQEQSFWTFESLSDTRFVSRFGVLEGVEVEDPPLRLQLTPYFSSTISEDFYPGQVIDADIAVRGGIDMRYGITPQFNLDATVLPDFGQVEVDQAQINLTAFENFFPEKRPFFLEGADVFQHPGDNSTLFYSRRIGARGAEILGATKLTGRTTSGLGVGVIQGFTGPLIDTYTTESGEEQAYLIEPASSYSVGRVRQDFNGQSYVGAIATAVVRPDSAFSDNGSDIERSPNGYRDAYSGAVDFNLTDDEARYAATGLVGGSVTTPDGEIAKGGIVDLTLNKNSGKYFVTALHYDYASPELDINDMGFIQRTDQHNGWWWWQLRNLDGVGKLRQVRWNSSFWGGALGTLGLRSHGGMDSNVWLQFPTFATLEVGGGYGIGGYDPYEARAGRDYLLKRPPEYWFWAGAQSNPRRSIIVALNSTYGYDYFGGEAINVRPSVVLQVGKQAEFELGGYTRLAKDEVYWVENLYVETAPETFEPDPILGRQATVQGDIYHRGMLTFTRDLSLQYFTQFQISKVGWSEYYHLKDDGGISAAIGGEYNASPSALARTNYAFFQANVRLRWEYRPGSLIYLVWTQSRFDNSAYDAALPERLASAFKGGSANALVFKLSYRWGAEDTWPRSLFARGA